MILKKILFVVTIALGLLTLSCSGDDDGPPTAIITIETIGLQPLVGGSFYQGWLMVNGVAKPTTKFNNPTGQKMFNVLASDLKDATEFLLSIEAVNDSDNVPSSSFILKGTFVGNSAQLSFDPVVADFANATGQFFLATPTDSDSQNDEFGVWFMNGTSAGLSLPILQNGWKYEGWVNFGTKIVSTGSFSIVDATDDANFYKGSGGTIPGFPGEDFLNIPSQIPLTGIIFPASVKSKTVFISIEPVKDNDPNPFFIQPLSGMAGITIGPANPVTMTLNSAVPTGRVTRPSL